MAYGSRRLFGYDSDTSRRIWGLKLSELIYEKNPQLGTSGTLTPPSEATYYSLPKCIRPRRAIFANPDAQATREYIVLSVQAPIWKGDSNTISVPSQSPTDSNFNIATTTFRLVAMIGETATLLIPGVDTGQNQGDQDGGNNPGGSPSGSPSGTPGGNTGGTPGGSGGGGN